MHRGRPWPAHAGDGPHHVSATAADGLGTRRLAVIAGSGIAAAPMAASCQGREPILPRSTPHDIIRPVSHGMPQAGRRPTITAKRKQGNAMTKLSKVRSVELLACDAGWREYHFVKLTTEDGRRGWGESRA